MPSLKTCKQIENLFNFNCVKQFNQVDFLVKHDVIDLAVPLTIMFCVNH